MTNEIGFTAADQDELDAADVLFNDTRGEEFFSSLSRLPDGRFAVNFKRGETWYTLRNSKLTLLAIDFLEFTVERYEKQRERERQAEAERQAHEQAEQNKRDLLGRALLGGGL